MSLVKWAPYLLKLASRLRVEAADKPDHRLFSAEGPHCKGTELAEDRTIPDHPEPPSQHQNHLTPPAIQTFCDAPEFYHQRGAQQITNSLFRTDVLQYGVKKNGWQAVLSAVSYHAKPDANQRQRL